MVLHFHNRIFYEHYYVIPPSALYIRNCSYEGDWSTWDDSRWAAKSQILNPKRFHPAPLLLHCYYLPLSILHLLNSGTCSFPCHRKTSRNASYGQNLAQDPEVWKGFIQMYAHARTHAHRHTHFYIQHHFFSCFLICRSTETHREV